MIGGPHRSRLVPPTERSRELSAPHLLQCTLYSYIRVLVCTIQCICTIYKYIRTSDLPMTPSADYQGLSHANWSGRPIRWPSETNARPARHSLVRRQRRGRLMLDCDWVSGASSSPILNRVPQRHTPITFVFIRDRHSKNPQVHDRSPLNCRSKDLEDTLRSTITAL